MLPDPRYSALLGGRKESHNNGDQNKAAASNIYSANIPMWSASRTNTTCLEQKLSEAAAPKQKTAKQPTWGSDATTGRHSCVCLVWELLPPRDLGAGVLAEEMLPLLRQQGQLP